MDSGPEYCREFLTAEGRGIDSLLRVLTLPEVALPSGTRASEQCRHASVLATLFTQSRQASVCKLLRETLGTYLESLMNSPWNCVGMLILN